MQIKKVWEGSLPLYWDVNQWFYIVEDEIFILSKNDDHRRKIEIVNLLDLDERSVLPSKWNSIIGFFNGNLFLCKIDDARSHLNINRLTAFNISSRTKEWGIKEGFLIEKFKTPYFNKDDLPFYYIGSNEINLNSGVFLNKKKKNANWILGNGLLLKQDDSTLTCKTNLNKEIWRLESYYGNWFQFEKDSQLYFLLPNNYLEVFNRDTGDKLISIFLENIKRVSNSISGIFDIRNELSFTRTSLHDVLINEEVICWITLENELIIWSKKRKTFRKLILPKRDWYLAEINSEHIILLDIESYEKGSIYTAKLEDVFFE